MSFLYWIYWWTLPSCLHPHLTRKAEWYKGRTILRKLGLKVLVMWEVSIPNFVFSSVQWGQEQLAALRTAWGLRETVLVRGPLRTQAGGLIDKMHARIRTPQILFSFTRYRSDTEWKRGTSMRATAGRSDRQTLTCPAPPAGFSAGGWNLPGQGGHPSPLVGPVGAPAFL